MQTAYPCRDGIYSCGCRVPQIHPTGSSVIPLGDVPEEVVSSGKMSPGEAIHT